MEEIRRCTRCIIPGVLPSVKFDKDSVCNYCEEYDNLFSNWSNTQLQRKQEFEDILQRARRLKRSYDCLVTLSGGKDSTYALYLCDKIYELKVLDRLALQPLSDQGCKR